jgi:16S rRNA (uracil1498-N3)-methyltransferase
VLFRSRARIANDAGKPGPRPTRKPGLAVMHRFFVPASLLKADLIKLSGDQAHQIRRVLRLQAGDPLLLLDNAGWAYECRLSGYEGDCASVQVVQRSAATGESRVHITLFQAILKGDHFAWALQKCTEVGVQAFVPLICARCVVGDLRTIQAKHERWERILREAAEQSGRGRIPVLAQAQALDRAVISRPIGDGVISPALRLMPWEGERRIGLAAALANCNVVAEQRIQLFVGPEGGFAEEEVRLAREHGVQPVSLGPRILRAETAGVVAATAILYQAGEMSPPED